MATARKPTLSSSILVAYPRLNQSERVFPLVHSQHKLDPVVDDGAQDQRKIYSIYGGKHKRNVSFLEAMRIVGSYMGENSYASVARRADRNNDDDNNESTRGEIDSFGSQWLAKLSGAPEKTTFDRILSSTSSVTGWEWEETQCCSQNKNTRKIYHSNTNYF